MSDRKKSWKEIDQMRDGSRGSGGGGDRGPRRGPNQKSYRAKLDRLFNSGKISDLVAEKTEQSDAPDDESRTKLLAAIRAAETPAAITKAGDAYLKSYELPNDFEILEKLLQHRNIGRKLDTMEKLDALLDSQQPKRARGIVGQLKYLRDTADDPEVETLAEKLIERLD